MEWYEIEANARTDEQQREAKIAYYQALLANAYGRQVLADMRRRVNEMRKLLVDDTDYAVGIILLADFMDETRLLCGVHDEMAVIRAEQHIANKVDEVQEEQLQPEGFRKE